MDGFLHFLQAPAQGLQGSPERVGAGAGPSKRGTSERRSRRTRRFGEKPISSEPSIVAEFPAIFTGFSRSAKDLRGAVIF
jgi:hypothetical protein